MSTFQDPNRPMSPIDRIHMLRRKRGVVNPEGSEAVKAGESVPTAGRDMPEKVGMPSMPAQEPQQPTAAPETAPVAPPTPAPAPAEVQQPQAPQPPKFSLTPEEMANPEFMSKWEDMTYAKKMEIIEATPGSRLSDVDRIELDDETQSLMASALRGGDAATEEDGEGGFFDWLGATTTAGVSGFLDWIPNVASSFSEDLIEMGSLGPFERERPENPIKKIFGGPDGRLSLLNVAGSEVAQSITEMQEQYPLSSGIATGVGTIASFMVPGGQATGLGKIGQFSLPGRAMQAGTVLGAGAIKGVSALAQPLTKSAWAQGFKASVGRAMTATPVIGKPALATSKFIANLAAKNGAQFVGTGLGSAYATVLTGDQREAVVDRALTGMAMGAAGYTGYAIANKVTSGMIRNRMLPHMSPEAVRAVNESGNLFKSGMFTDAFLAKAVGTALEGAGNMFYDPNIYPALGTILNAANESPESIDKAWQQITISTTSGIIGALIGRAGNDPAWATLVTTRPDKAGAGLFYDGIYLDTIKDSHLIWQRDTQAQEKAVKEATELETAARNVAMAEAQRKVNEGRPLPGEETLLVDALTRAGFRPTLRNPNYGVMMGAPVGGHRIWVQNDGKQTRVTISGDVIRTLLSREVVPDYLPDDIRRMPTDKLESLGTFTLEGPDVPQFMADLGFVNMASEIRAHAALSRQGVKPGDISGVGVYSHKGQQFSVGMDGTVFVKSIVDGNAIEVPKSHGPKDAPPVQDLGLTKRFEKMKVQPRLPTEPNEHTTTPDNLAWVDFSISMKARAAADASGRLAGAWRAIESTMYLATYGDSANPYVVEVNKLFEMMPRPSETLPQITATPESYQRLAFVMGSIATGRMTAETGAAIIMGGEPGPVPGARPQEQPAGRVGEGPPPGEGPAPTPAEPTPPRPAGPGGAAPEVAPAGAAPEAAPPAAEPTPAPEAPAAAPRQRTFMDLMGGPREIESPNVRLVEPEAAPQPAAEPTSQPETPAAVAAEPQRPAAGREGEAGSVFIPYGPEIGEAAGRVGKGIMGKMRKAYENVVQAMGSEANFIGRLSKRVGLKLQSAHDDERRVGGELRSMVENRVRQIDKLPNAKEVVAHAEDLMLDPKTGGYVSRLQNAHEGLGVDDPSKPAGFDRVVGAYHDVVVESGRKLEEAGLVQRRTDGGLQRFTANENRRRFLRMGRPELYEVLGKPAGKAFETLVDVLAKGNNLDPKVVADGLTKENATTAAIKKVEMLEAERQVAADFSRSLDYFPAAIEVDGKIIQLLETDLQSNLTRIADDSAMRYGIVKNLGNNITAEQAAAINADGKPPVKVLNDVMTEFTQDLKTSGRGDEYKTIRLQNVIARAQNLTQGTFMGAMEGATMRTAAKIEGELRLAKLTVSSVANLVEPAGTLPQYVGFKDTARAYYRVLKDAAKVAVGRAMRQDVHMQTRDAAVESGALITGVSSKAFDSSRFHGKLIDTLRSIASGGFEKTQAFAEIVAAEAGRIKIENWKAGKFRASDEIALRSLDFTPEQIEAFRSGNFDDALGKAFIGRMAGEATSTRVGARKAFLTSSKEFNLLFPFNRYFMGRMKSAARAALEVKRDPTNPAAWGTLARLVGGSIIGGTLANYLMRSIKSLDPAETLEQMWREATAAPATFAMEQGRGQVIGGPLVSSVYNFGNPAVSIERLFSAARPIQIGVNAIEAYRGLGPYRGMTTTERLGAYFSRVAAVMPVMERAVSLAFLDDMASKVATIQQNVNKWARDNEKVKFYSQEPVDPKLIAFRKSVREAVDMLNRGAELDSPELVAKMAEAMDLGPGENLRQSIRNFKILTGRNIEDDERIELMRNIGEDNYATLMAHDNELERLALTIPTDTGLPDERADFKKRLDDAAELFEVGDFATIKSIKEDLVGTLTNKIAASRNPRAIDEETDSALQQMATMLANYPDSYDAVFGDVTATILRRRGNRPMYVYQALRAQATERAKAKIKEQARGR